MLLATALFATTQVDHVLDTVRQLNAQALVTTRYTALAAMSTALATRAAGHSGSWS